MLARPIHWLIVLLGVLVLLEACASPHSLPNGPTPIPSLIPATLPAVLPGSAQEASFTIQSYPARQPSASLGEALYRQECVSCHGEDGGGIVAGARNFNDLDYMRGETPASFYDAITEGRGEMPSFRDRMTSDERWDVVFYTWRFSTTAAVLALGQQVYATDCAACHGADGVGVVLGAADFTNLRLVDDRSSSDFYQVVTQGIGSMPAWQGRLSQDERWAVIDYLRTFSYEPGFAGQGVSDMPASSEPPQVVCDSTYEAPPNPYAWDAQEALAAGQTIYDQSCAMCHAADGTGSLQNTPDLTTSAARSKILETSAEQFCIVEKGQEAMPGWKGTLSADEMWQVLVFVASLGR